MKKLLTSIIALLFSLTVAAQETASDESLEKLLEITESSKLVDAVYDQVGSMFQGMSQQMNVPPEKHALVNAYMEKVLNLMKEGMSWEVLKPQMMTVYSTHFSQREVDGLIAFYETEIGQATIKKMPLIMQDSMMLSQNMVMKLMPKIQALAAEMQQEINTPATK